MFLKNICELHSSNGTEQKEGSENSDVEVELQKLEVTLSRAQAKTPCYTVVINTV